MGGEAWDRREVFERVVEGRWDLEDTGLEGLKVEGH